MTHQWGHEPLKRATNRIDPSRDHDPFGGHDPPMRSRPTKEVTTPLNEQRIASTRLGIANLTGSRPTHGVTNHQWGHDPPKENESGSIHLRTTIHLGVTTHQWGHDPPMGSRPTNGVTTYQKVTTQFRLFFLFARSRPFFFIERPLKVTNDCWPSSSGGGSDQLTPNVQRPTANERATKKKRRKRPRFSFIHSFDGHHASTRFSQRETTLSLSRF